jgi:hypothetical protein
MDLGRVRAQARRGAEGLHRLVEIAYSIQRVPKVIVSFRKVRIKADRLAEFPDGGELISLPGESDAFAVMLQGGFRQGRGLG